MSGFCPANISHWGELTDKASVPFIPLHGELQFNVEQLLNSPDYQRQVISDIFAWNKTEGDVIFRLSCCANSFLRHSLNAGSTKFNDLFKVFNPATDFNAQKVLKTYPYKSVEGYLRPWVEPKIFEGFPVEFMVFVIDNKVRAVSNAYPQRGLPETTEVYDFILEAIFYTNKLISYQKQPMFMPDYWYHDDRKNHWTVNFMVDAENNLRMVDGSRPLFDDIQLGCFSSRNKVQGIALRSQFV